jgi:hypothetical protein
VAFIVLVLEESNGLWDVAYEYDYEHHVAEYYVADYRIAEHRVLLSTRNPDFPTTELPEEPEQLGYIKKLTAS